MIVLTVAAVALSGTLVGVLLADWVQLRRLTRDSRPYASQVAEQRAEIDRMHRRISEMRSEVGAWREVHARLFDTFGPDGKPGVRDKGIGGPAAPVERTGPLSVQDDLNRLGDSIAEESQSLKVLDALMTRVGKMLAALPSRWPVRGAVNSEFGTRLSPWTKTPEFHAGMDIRAERGTEVQAPAAGVVTHAGAHAEYGLAVIVDHGNDIRSIYGHLSKISVQLGQRVERGTELGLTGNTGRSSGPHLHYEILVKGQAVNPRGYLWD
jgi:murein DD-endopeptidase MepM/ murein hydrolase activator NlpD